MATAAIQKNIAAIVIAREPLATVAIQKNIEKQQFGLSPREYRAGFLFPVRPCHQCQKVIH